MLAANLAVTACLTGLIWVIQIVHYPLFAHVGAAEFARYHALHVERITWLVGPLMLAEVVLAGVLVVEGTQAPRWLAWAAAALVGVAWLSTAVLSVPLHGALEADAGPGRAAIVARLVATNWPRTLAWTLRAALLLYATMRPNAAP